PLVEKNIFKSVYNINLDMVIGYKKGNKKHLFLDDYDKEEKK
ncbi:TPA: tRNA 2-thiocytidine biosynthesis protein TtcA, partial [bacterium]|nr:tRNA 2-thiocytidine biosynthesis protein TtcA [bacterium]